MDNVLFNLDSTSHSTSTRETENKRDWISTEEISKIRSAFTKAGINDQEKRQDFVQRTLGREISSLREVLGHEVPRVIYGIHDIIFAAKSSAGNERSAWDERDEDTWIDKL